MPSSLRVRGYSHFSHLAQSYSRTLSRLARPRKGEVVFEYDTTVERLLALDTFPVWYVHPTTGLLVKDERRHRRVEAIRLSDLATHSTIAKELLEGWYREDLGVPTNPRVLMLHCAGCHRRVVIDGIHRLLWLARNGHRDAPVRVCELSGTHWPATVPDMRVVCQCRPWLPTALRRARWWGLRALRVSR